MTNEEREDAINFFKEVAEREVNNAKYSRLAIKALEQKSCDDCISRQAVLSYISNDLGFGDEENGYDLVRKIAQEEIYNFVKSLPTAIPTPREKEE